jgi:ubiquinone/menaquinone biosynthesis C-methylase UbiE
VTQSADTADDWDESAAGFDQEPDHGLLDPLVHAAWRGLLMAALPPAPAVIADLGCGTGSLSVLLAQEQYVVRGLDSSPAMLEHARAKAAARHVTVDWVLGDAGSPALDEQSVDVVLCRHVLWALADPSAAVARWVRLLRPGGRLVLIEGSWDTGVGLRADETRALVLASRAECDVHPLDNVLLWGGPISDERYLAMSLS